MVLKEFNRLIKSKSTLIILVLVGISVFSFIFFSLSEKQMFIDQLSSGAPDLNISALRELIDNFTGVRFVFDFWFVSDFFILFIVALLLWIGIFLSANLQVQKENGFGNLIVTRSEYKYYLRSMLQAQTLYIFTVITISTGLMTLIALFMGGVSFHYIPLGGYDLSLSGAIMIMTAQVILMSISVSLINAICLVSSLWINNKYVIQALPLVGFGLLPWFLGAMSGGLSRSFERLIIYFAPHNLFYTLEPMINEHFQLSEIVILQIPLITYSILFIVLYKLNIKKFSDNYL